MLFKKENWIKTGYIDNGVVLSHDGTFKVPFIEFEHCFPNPYDGVYTDSDGLKYGYIISEADCKDSIQIIHFDYMESLHEQRTTKQR